MVLNIALKDLKVVFRDKKALAVMLLMPALIILILGNALGAVFVDESPIDRFAIGVVNKDEGFMSGVFINQVLRENMSELIDTYVVNEGKAIEMLENKRVPSIIIIPEGFSKGVDNGKPVKMEVRSQVDGQMKALIVESIAESYVRSLSLSYAGAITVVNEMEAINVDIPVPVRGMSQTTAVMGKLQKQLSSGIIEFKETNQEKNKMLSALQYYSAAMLVMFILFGANVGIGMMAEERESKTMGRIISAGAGKSVLISGKFLGLYFICMMQALILILFTRFIYRVDWGGSISGILLITVCAIFAGSGFCMFIAAVTRTAKAAEGLAMILIQLFTMVGGGMVPYYVLPEGIRKAAQVTLNWWAVKGYHDLMLGASIVTILPYCAILVLMGMVYMGIGIWGFKIE